jgi:hypothetical protein
MSEDKPIGPQVPNKSSLLGGASTRAAFGLDKDGRLNSAEIGFIRDHRTFVEILHEWLKEDFSGNIPAFLKHRGLGDAITQAQFEALLRE